VGAGAVVTKDVPDYCVVAGVPAKVIFGPPDYPQKLSEKEKDNILWQIMMEYAELLRDKIDGVIVESNAEKVIIKGFYNGIFEIEYWNREIIVKQNWKIFVISPIEGTWYGEDGEISDDLRDFLRHYGIRIFSRQMVSIKSKIRRELESI
jgi:hypothetical protein